jgi:CubicO group peptidase (beta-lactamase class C family)
VFVSALAGLVLAQSASVDPGALQRLIARCTEYRSWGLVVLKDGKTVAKRNFGVKAPACNLMSATKSITVLAIALLIDEGKLTLNTPLHNLFPEYTGPRKDKVTVEHLLEHTSGIKLWDSEPTLNLRDIASRVRDALEAPVVSEPGKVFAYNNRATNLLSGVVRKAAGQPMDDYLRAKLFQPMGIEIFWIRDKAGDPHGCAELLMSPSDMAKIGQLVLDQGKWNGKQLISSEFIKEMTTDRGHGAGCGWLWWIETKLYGFDQNLFDTLAKAKASDALIKRLSPLRNRWFEGQVAAAIAIDWQAGTGPLKDEFYAKGAKDGYEVQNYEKFITARKDPPAFSAKGWGGQYIVVVPESGIVAVRTSADAKVFDDDAVGFDMPDFIGLVRALDPKFNN